MSISDGKPLSESQSRITIYDISFDEGGVTRRCKGLQSDSVKLPNPPPQAQHIFLSRQDVAHLSDSLPPNTLLYENFDRCLENLQTSSKSKDRGGRLAPYHPPDQTPESLEQDEYEHPSQFDDPTPSTHHLPPMGEQHLQQAPPNVFPFGGYHHQQNQDPHSNQQAQQSYSEYNHLQGHMNQPSNLNQDTVNVRQTYPPEHRTIAQPHLDDFPNPQSEPIISSQHEDSFQPNGYHHQQHQDPHSYQQTHYGSNQPQNHVNQQNHLNQDFVNVRQTKGRPITSNKGTTIISNKITLNNSNRLSHTAIKVIILKISNPLINPTVKVSFLINNNRLFNQMAKVTILKISNRLFNPTVKVNLLINSNRLFNPTVKVHFLNNNNNNRLFHQMVEVTILKIKDLRSIPLVQDPLFTQNNLRLTGWPQFQQNPQQAFGHQPQFTVTVFINAKYDDVMRLIPLNGQNFAGDFNPPTWILHLLFIFIAFQLLIHPSLQFEGSNLHLHSLLSLLGNYVLPSIYTPSMSSMIIFLVLGYIVVLIPLLLLAISTILLQHDKPVHRYILLSTKVSAFVVVYLLAFPMASLFFRPLLCVSSLRSPFLNYCNGSSNYALVIISLFFYLILVIFTFLYSFFAIETDVSKPSLLRARSGFTRSVLITLSLLFYAASTFVIQYSRITNSILQTVLAAVAVAYILYSPPLFSTTGCTIYFAIYATALYGGIFSFILPLFNDMAHDVPSTILANLLTYLLLFGPPIAIWVLSLTLGKKLFQWRWVIKPKFESIDEGVDSNDPDLFHEKEKKSTLTGFEVKIGKEVFVYDQILTSMSFHPSFQQPNIQHSLSPLPSILPTKTTSPLLPGVPVLSPKSSQQNILLSSPQLSSYLVAEEHRSKGKAPPVELNDANLELCLSKVVKTFRGANRLLEKISFLQHPEILHNQFTLHFCDQIFRLILTKERFSTLPNVRVSYALFLAHFYSSQHRMVTQITKACDFYPGWTDRWICYVKTKEIEKSMSGKQNGAPSMPTMTGRRTSLKSQIPRLIRDEEVFTRLERQDHQGEDNSSASKMFHLQTQMKQAEKLYTLAKAHLRVMWTSLGRYSVDVQKVQDHATKAIESETAATKLYLTMLKEHHNNPSVLRPFALLLRDVSADEDSANLLFQEADRIEDENETIPEDWDSNDQKSNIPPTIQQPQRQQPALSTSPLGMIRSTGALPRANGAGGQPTKVGGNSNFKLQKGDSGNVVQLLIGSLQTSGGDNRSYRFTYPLIISSLLIVFCITLAAFIVANSAFSVFTAGSLKIQQASFVTTTTEHISFLLCSIDYLLQHIVDPEHPTAAEQPLVDYLTDYIDKTDILFSEYTTYMQDYYRNCDQKHMWDPGMTMSVVSAMNGRSLKERDERTLTYRQFFFRFIEPIQAVPLAIGMTSDDRSELLRVTTQVRMNSPLSFTEAVKKLSSETIEEIEMQSLSGLIAQIALMFVGTIVLICSATLPICLQIRKINKFGRDQLEILCGVKQDQAKAIADQMDRSMVEREPDTFSETASTVSAATNNKDEEEMEQDEPNETDIAIQERKESERADDVADKLRKTSTFVPAGFYASLIFGTMLIVLVSYTFFIISMIALVKIPELSRLIILNGHRRVYFNQLLALTVSVLEPTLIALDDPANSSLLYQDTSVTTPVMTNTSFIHSDEELRLSIQRLSHYLIALSARFLNGKNGETMTGDDFYDSLTTSGIRGRHAEIDALNTEDSNCFMQDKTQCAKYVVPELVGNLHGMLQAMSMACDRAFHLSLNDGNTFKFDDDYVQFFIVLTEHHLAEGITTIATILREELSKLSRQYETILVVVIVIVCVSEVLFAAILIIPLPPKLNNVNNNLRRMTNLVNVTKSKKIEWEEDMNIGVIRIDTLHETTYQSLGEILTAVETRQKKVDICEILDQLISTTAIMFSDEENLMSQHGYPSTLAQNHRKQHVLLFKKLLDFSTVCQNKRPTFQNTSDFCSLWIKGHFESLDNELGLFLLQHAPPSALTDIPEVDEITIPDSVVRYYMRSTTDLKEQTAFTQMIDRLGIDLDGDGEDEDLDI
ncbi:putative hemerythrin [Blattamonas nauphoetae]|uniref:Hemerythrin n=1 Tax=Blattamonas nauphoetae TaxID=2049346 RepID=A0ABQ9YGE2_9EUKA|nr:putative hemerythrin [Blattamonas nauphoetae]